MNRIALFLGALLVGIALTGTGASAHGWGHGWFGWHHHSPHYGWRYHAAGAPTQAGPFCWLDTDSARGFGFYKVCPDGARPVARGDHTGTITTITRRAARSHWSAFTFQLASEAASLGGLFVYRGSTGMPIM